VEKLLRLVFLGASVFADVLCHSFSPLVSKYIRLSKLLFVLADYMSVPIFGVVP
jgi:hypothetical protein